MIDNHEDAAASLDAHLRRCAVPLVCVGDAGDHLIVYLERLPKMTRIPDNWEGRPVKVVRSGKVRPA